MNFQYWLEIAESGDITELQNKVTVPPHWENDTVDEYVLLGLLVDQFPEYEEGYEAWVNS
jgi:hypothetical protein